MPIGLQHGPWVARPRGIKTLVPHTSLGAGPLKMYIVRKPHNNAIKLYCWADASTGYNVEA